jgi:hypothetical protein
MDCEMKNRFEDRLSELKHLFRVTDPVYKFIKEDHIGDFIFKTGLRMLPFELVEKYGSVILQDENQYSKYSDPKYDVYLSEWEKHYEGYWNDKLRLLEEYLQPVGTGKTPLEIYNQLNDLMIKIERRSLLLVPDPKSVEQKHTRISGMEKDYLFLRNYWVDEDGVKKRMISKHVGEKYQNIEQEVMDMFHHKGYGVIRDYRSEKGFSYDVVIQRGDMKTVVEIKMVNKDIFNQLFMFDELLKKFQEQYPNE